MGKHRKPTPAGSARRQLAIAGLGVVAVGGVLSSQMTAQNHFASHQPKGGPADIPSILSADGNTLGTLPGSGDGPAANPTTTARTVNTAETTPAHGSTEPAAPTTDSYAWPTESRDAPPAPQQTEDVPTTTPAPSAGSALAMLGHAPKSGQGAQRRQATQQNQDSGADAPESTPDSASPQPHGESDHSIPDELTTQHPTTTSQPSTTGDPRSNDLVRHLLGRVSGLDVSGALGLPARNATTSGGAGTTQQPPHDTAGR